MAGVNPAIRIPAEVGSNTRYYSQTPIVPRGLAENVLPADQVRSTTSQVATSVARAIGMSPMKLEYMVGAATGGLGTAVLDTIDEALGQSRISSVAGPWEQASRRPLLGRLLGRGGDAQARETESRFYDALEEGRRGRGGGATRAGAGGPGSARGR